MKKLLFLALTNYEDLANGVSKKVISQVKGLEKNSFSVTLIAYSNDGVWIVSSNGIEKFIKLNKFKTNRSFLFGIALKLMKSEKFDTAYIRYPHVDFKFLKLLRVLKKSKSKIYIELPSYPIVYKNKNIKSFIYRIYNLINTPKLKRYVYKIVTIGASTQSVFGIEAINIPNGINTFFENKVLFNLDKTSINIISVSAIYQPHGYDLLIEGLKDYYKNKDKKYNIYFHLVGDGPLKQKLIDLTNSFNLEGYVKFYPNTSGEALDKIYSLANMGCGPLGIHRIGYQVASPLKTRDYFIKGLPYFCSYKEIGLNDDYPYVLQLDGKEEKIDLGKIVKFFETYINDFDNASNQMKKFANENFTWQNILSIVK